MHGDRRTCPIGPAINDDSGEEAGHFYIFNDCPGRGGHYLRLTVWKNDGRRWHDFNYFRFDGRNSCVEAVGTTPFEVIDEIPRRLQHAATAEATEFMANDYSRLLSGHIAVLD